MTNSDFTQKTDKEKKDNLVKILYKRCNGCIRPDVLYSVINKIDIHKQMKVDVLNESVFTEQAKTVTEIIINSGDICKIHIQWCRCLLGKVNIGNSSIVYEDGNEKLINSVRTKVISKPSIVQIEEQNLGDVDYNTQRVIILL